MTHKHPSRIRTVFSADAPTEENPGILPSVKLISLGVVKGWRRLTTEKNFEEIFAAPSFDKDAVACYLTHNGWEGIGKHAGHFKNVRLSADKQSIIGDLVLSEVLKSQKIEGCELSTWDYILTLAKENAPGVGISIEFAEDWDYRGELVDEHATYRIVDFYGAAITERPAATDTFFSQKNHDKAKAKIHPSTKGTFMKKCTAEQLLKDLQSAVDGAEGEDVEIDLKNYEGDTPAEEPVAEEPAAVVEDPPVEAKPKEDDKFATKKPIKPSFSRTKAVKEYDTYQEYIQAKKLPKESEAKAYARLKKEDPATFALYHK